VKIELTPDAAQWVQAELAAGRFPTAEDAIRRAINQAKLVELRAELAAAEAEAAASRRMTCAVTRAITSIVSNRRPRHRCRASFTGPLLAAP
jgi:Arc/MetJ-type ribon-helix-helix transcriptional regulator